MLVGSATKHIQTVSNRSRRSTFTWSFWYIGILAISGLLGLLMLRQGYAIPSFLAWLIYLSGALTILYQPRYGIYIILTLTLLGDGYLAAWYPFTKNFSSRESLMYLNDSLIINPLESYLFLTFLSWLGRGAMQRKIRFYVSELFWPAIAFAVFVIVGLLYGIGTGGDFNIALWEARPLFYLVAMIILTSNLLTKREHVSYLLWSAMLGLFIEGLFGTYFVFVKLNGDLSSVPSITDHAAAMHMNTMFILLIAVWFYKGSSAKRIGLLLMVPFVAITYIATQRRAAFLTLGIALALVFVVIFKENRRLFWIIVPPVIMIGLAYTAIFWNNSGPLGLPAQAVKSVVAEDQANAADLSSNVYRLIENFNTSFTIHQKPLTGVGFGQKFFVVVPLPDISFFAWWQYLPHNSIIWIWLKMGVGGFLTMLFLVGWSVVVGVRALWRMPRNDLSAAALTMTLYIVMHFIFAYVDISWDSQSMVYVGAAIGLTSGLERIVSHPIPLQRKRWPWQLNPTSHPSLVPLSSGK